MRNQPQEWDTPHSVSGVCDISIRVVLTSEMHRFLK